MNRLFRISIIRRSDLHPWFYAPALSSFNTVKCTPCQIANNIMQMIPNIEDRRNSMQILCVRVTTKQQSNMSRMCKHQKNARAETRAQGFMAHSNTNKFSRGTYSNWNLWDIINLSTNECGIISGPTKSCLEILQQLDRRWKYKWRRQSKQCPGF